eukprot:11173133-Lingulodinium_polyedra.AAC.1
MQESKRAHAKRARQNAFSKGASNPSRLHHWLSATPSVRRRYARTCSHGSTPTHAPICTQHKTRATERAAGRKA